MSGKMGVQLNYQVMNDFIWKVPGSDAPCKWYARQEQDGMVNVGV